MKNLCEERKLQPSIWFDEINEVLGTQTSKQVTDIRTDEVVVHDCRTIIFQDFLGQVNLAPLVGIDEVSHSFDLRVCLVSTMH